MHYLLCLSWWSSLLDKQTTSFLAFPRIFQHALFILIPVGTCGVFQLLQFLESLPIDLSSFGSHHVPFGGRPMYISNHPHPVFVPSSVNPPSHSSMKLHCLLIVVGAACVLTAPIPVALDSITIGSYLAKRAPGNSNGIGNGNGIGNCNGGGNCNGIGNGNSLTGICNSALGGLCNKWCQITNTCP